MRVASEEVFGGAPDLVLLPEHGVSNSAGCECIIAHALQGLTDLDPNTTIRLTALE